MSAERNGSWRMRVNDLTALDWPRPWLPEGLPEGAADEGRRGSDSAEDAQPSCFDLATQRVPRARSRPVGEAAMRLPPTTRARPEIAGLAFDQAAVLNLQRLAGNRAVTSL